MIRKYEYYLKRTILLLAIDLPLRLFSQQGMSGCQMKEPENTVYVIAHRGAHKGIPENSIAAYQKAIDLGCDFVEIDVRTTKDGKFVSIHNPNIDKYVSGYEGKVKDYTFKELKSLDIGVKTGAEWKGTRIPSFEEILELCRGKIGIYLDLKKAPVPRLVEIIKKYGMEKEILWYIPASDTKDIDDLQASCPECILMPDPGSEINIQAVTEKMNPCVLATGMDQLSEGFVKVTHSYKAKVIADDKAGNEEEWKKIIEWKTDGIQTDRPEELIYFLKSLKR